MNRKNVIRTLTVIAVVLLLGWSFFYFSDDTRGYKPVDTSVATAQINSGNVSSAQIDDREQRVRIDLREPITVDEREGVVFFAMGLVEGESLAARLRRLSEALPARAPRVRAG